MSKKWWTTRNICVAQAICLGLLVAWSVHHIPGEPAAPRPAAADAVRPAEAAVVDNSDTAVDVSAQDEPSEVDARFIAPAPVRFRTENPAPGSLDLRPLEVDSSASPDDADPWQPVQPQNPPQQVRPESRPLDLNGATVVLRSPGE